VNHIHQLKKSVINILEVAAGLESPTSGNNKKKKIITIHSYIDYILDCYKKYTTKDIKSVLDLVDCIKISLNKIGSDQETLKKTSIQTIDESIVNRINSTLNNNIQPIESIQSIIDSPNFTPDVKKSLVAKLLPTLGEYRQVYTSLVKIHQKHPEYLGFDILCSIFSKIIDSLPNNIDIDTVPLSSYFKSAVLVYKDQSLLTKLFNQYFKYSKEAQIEAFKQIRSEYKYNAQDTQLNDLIAVFWGCVAGRAYNGIENPQYAGTTAWAAKMVECSCDGCEKLKQWFLKPRNRDPFVYRAVEKERKHMKSVIYPFEMFLDSQTISGKPCSLVITKKCGQAIDDLLNNEMVAVIQPLKEINSYIYPEMIRNVPFVRQIYNSIQKKIKQMENREPLGQQTLTLPNLNITQTNNNLNYGNNNTNYLNSIFFNNNNKKDIIVLD